MTVDSASGAWVEDVRGDRYLDLIGAYSALNFGHGHPDLIAAATAQLRRLTLTSRAVGSSQLKPFCAELAALCDMESVLVMNTGAEAVETALKMARKWAYEVKGVAPGQATIVTMSGNFHGRTISIVSFSDDPTAFEGFGPYTPGFVTVAFGDMDALDRAIDENTAAVLLEPVQGEAGVVSPPAGYLREVRRLCDERSVLMIADEIQSGLGRTGRTFACDHEGVRPDAYVLGKALGGGIVPVSAVVADSWLMGVFRPGQHGSTFGGNPLACAVGRAVLRLLASGEPQRRATELGALMESELRDMLASPSVAAIRTQGLWAGIDLVDRSGRNVCEGLARRGVLAKETHGSTLRLAPPLVIDPEDMRWGIRQLRDEVDNP